MEAPSKLELRMYYRYEGRVIGEDLFTHRVTFFVNAYPVLSETPKGVWIFAKGRKAFVLNKARKKYAYPTVEQAWEAFKHRKRRRIELLRIYLELEKAVLEEAKKHDEPPAVKTWMGW